MNKFEKRLGKVKNPSKAKKWWGKNGYKVMRVIFFPIWICSWLYTKHEERIYNTTTFTPERAKKFLDKYLPAVLEPDDNGEWSFCLEWRSVFRTKGKKDKIFQRKFYHKILDYLEMAYEVEGFSKYTEKNDYEGWVVFKKDGDS